MDYAGAIAYINQWIIDNNNKEITASVMRDVLEKMLLYVRTSDGYVSDLEQGENLVEAINILFGLVEDIQIDFPITVHEGSANPNILPPTSFEAPDFYIRDGVQTYIYTGTNWVLISDSSTPTIPNLESVVQEGNTTSKPLIGLDYFANKSNNDFAQIADIISNNSGVSFLGVFYDENTLLQEVGDIGDFAILDNPISFVLYIITQDGWVKIGEESDSDAIEMRVFEDVVQYKAISDLDWIDLFELNDITPSFRVENNVFQYKKKPTSSWQTIIDFTDLAPTIGSNGNWYVNGVDTGVKSQVVPTTVYDDDITGLRNGVNTDFLAPDEFISGSLDVYLDGLRLSKGNNKDYTEIAQGARINRVITPQSLLIFEYIKE